MPTYIQIETEDVFSGYGSCIMLRMQHVCVFKYVISDSRYHTHFSEDLQNPSELAKSYRYPYSQTTCTAGQSKVVGFVEKTICLFISRSSQTYEQTRFHHHIALLRVWDFAITLPRNGRLSTLFFTAFPPP